MFKFPDQSQTAGKLELGQSLPCVPIQVWRFNDGALAQTVFIKHPAFLWPEHVSYLIHRPVHISDNQTYGFNLNQKKKKILQAGNDWENAMK